MDDSRFLFCFFFLVTVSFKDIELILILTMSSFEHVHTWQRSITLNNYNSIVISIPYLFLVHDSTYFIPTAIAFHSDTFEILPSVSFLDRTRGSILTQVNRQEEHPVLNKPIRCSDHL